MQLEPMPRRKLLKWGVFGVVALGSATTFMLGDRGGDERAAGESLSLLVFNRDHAQTLLAMLQMVLPSSHVTNAALHNQVLSRIDEEFYFVDGKIQADFCLALDVLEYLPILFGHFSRFSKLSRVDRDEFLARMQNTRSDTFRAVINNCRLFPLYVYYGLEVSWQTIGYDGPFSRIKPVVSEQRQFYADLVKGKGV